MTDEERLQLCVRKELDPNPPAALVAALVVVTGPMSKEQGSGTAPYFAGFVHGAEWLAGELSAGRITPNQLGVSK